MQILVECIVAPMLLYEHALEDLNSEIATTPDTCSNLFPSECATGADIFNANLCPASDTSVICGVSISIVT